VLRAFIPSSCGRMWALRAVDGAFSPSPITQQMTPPYVYEPYDLPVCSFLEGFKKT